MANSDIASRRRRRHVLRWEMENEKKSLLDKMDGVHEKDLENCSTSTLCANGQD